MEKIGEGHKSEVFLLPDGRILKLFFPRFASLAPEEIDVSRILERAGVNAPRLDEVTCIDGRPGIIFGDLRAGTTLSSAVRRRPLHILAMAAQLARVHSAVHDCRSTELPSQRQRLEAEIRHARSIPEGVRRDALAILSELPDADTVCHNDIHMLNVIVHPQQWMIIDWVLATRGNPLADVAGAVLQLRFGERPDGVVASAALEGGRALFWRTYLRNYLAIRPQVRKELARWELPVAIALAGRREGRMRAQLEKRVGRLAGDLTVRTSGSQT